MKLAYPNVAGYVTPTRVTLLRTPVFMYWDVRFDVTGTPVHRPPGLGLHYARARTSNPTSQYMKLAYPNVAGYVTPTRVTLLRTPVFMYWDVRFDVTGTPVHRPPGLGLHYARARTSNPTSQYMKLAYPNVAGYVTPTRVTLLRTPVFMYWDVRFDVTGLCTHVHMYTCTHVHMYTCTHVHMYTCTHVHMYTCTHVHMYTCTHLPYWYELHCSTTT